MSYSTQQDILDFVEDNNVKFVRFAFCDIFGTQKNIAVLASNLSKALEEGVCFDGSSIAGFMHVEESDLVLRPDLSTVTILPWRPTEGRVMQFFCDVEKPDGQPFGGNCRGFLRSVNRKFKIEKKEIHLELLSDPVCISGLSIGFESVDAYPSNAPFHSSNYNEVKPVLFDEHTIIIPMFFWVASTTDAIQEELKRHSFMLVYDSNGNSDSNLGLCLLHNVSDDEYRIRTLYTVQYCAFDIASAISRFESEKGNKPSRMTIEYKVNSLSDRLEDARIEKYTLDYKFQ